LVCGVRELDVCERKKTVMWNLWNLECVRVAPVAASTNIAVFVEVFFKPRTDEGIWQKPDSPRDSAWMTGGGV